MLDLFSQKVLTDLLKQESSSLLQYAQKVFPWTTEKGASRVVKLLQIVEQDTAGLDVLLKFLAKQKLIPPPLGHYPSSFTSLNFLSLDYLHPLILKGQRAASEAVGQAAQQPVSAEVKELLKDHLDLKQKLVHELEHLDT